MHLHRSCCSTVLLCLLTQLGTLFQAQAQAGNQSNPFSEFSIALAISANSVPANSLRHPYVVSLLNSATAAYLCGGALVDAEYVVTAAQCVSNGGPVFVDIGIPSKPNHEKIGVVDILYPSKWNGDIRKGHDIALLKLKSPSRAPPVKFPPWRTEIADRETLVLLSRGRTSSSSSFTDILHKGRTNFIPTSECSATGLLGGLIQPGMMCLGGGGASACLGDEGSPVLRVGSSMKKDLLLGIASITENCGDPKNLGIYTRVDEYGSWISSIV